jgi:histidyl-tRNA synthetase
MINRVKGTQDFLDLALFNGIVDQAKKWLTLHNFAEISTPILEHAELFERSLGLETDVITKEMYLVTTTKSEAEHICLRPELTAPIVRAFVNNSVDITPWKVFSWGAIFRHERPQKGRYRQFHQISMEIIGARSIAHDAAFISLLDRFFQEKLHIKSYALLLNFLGCTQDQEEFKKVLANFLSQHKTSLCSTCLQRKEKNILRVFDCKSPECQTLYHKAPQPINHLCAECQDEWNRLQSLLLQLSVTFSIVPTLVRGLDYYHKTVFEFTSPHLGAQNSFCAGGRYDSLVQEIGGGADQPSVGAALGIERLMLLLENSKDQVNLSKPDPLFVIIPFSQAQNALALLLADTLAAHDIKIDIFLEEASLKSKLRKADRLQAAACLLLGENEQTTGTVTIKNMLTGQEDSIPQRDSVFFLRRLKPQ